VKEDKGDDEFTILMPYGAVTIRSGGIVWGSSLLLSTNLIQCNLSLPGRRLTNYYLIPSLLCCDGVVVCIDATVGKLVRQLSTLAAASRGFELSVLVNRENR
jgi:hypothetical protein